MKQEKIDPFFKKILKLNVVPINLNDKENHGAAWSRPH